MSKRSGALLAVILAGVFLAANREAYLSYFQDDEIDNVSWTRWAPATQYLLDTLSPKFFENNYRPVGYFYFHWAGNAFGLNYPKYILVIQAIHLLNAWLVWLLARRLGARPLAAGVACAFFLFHMGLFDVFWKPMYVFDLLCGTFCLASLLLYTQERIILSVVALWLAYKSKEMAVMLPVVLFCYEFWSGKRRWLRLAPFAAVSLLFGLQALVFHPNRDADYTFHFTLEALRKTVPFYSGRVFLVPYLGLLLPLAAVVVPNRRTWIGLATMAAFFVPMIFLPGRVFAAYCYLPFTGLVLVVAGLAEAASPAVLALFFLLWIPQDIHVFRLQRRETLTRATEVREWLTTLAAFAAPGPKVDAFVYSGSPKGFERWGVEGSLKYLFRRLEVRLSPASEPVPPGRVAILKWDKDQRRLEIEMVGP